MEAYKILGSKKTYGGLIIDVVQDEITLPDGKTSMREIVVHGGAAAILPIDSDGKIIFVRQYRHPVRDMVLEIPAGTLEKGEAPLTCAIRELEEETGYKTENMTLITEMYTSIGFCTERISIYLAKELKEGQMNLDEDEFVSIERYPVDEAVDMVLDGRIIDSKTMAGVLAYREMLNRA